MSSLLSISPILVEEGTCFQLGSFRITVKFHLGKFADVNYFNVNIQRIAGENLLEDNEANADRLGLLRVGDLDGGLSRELQLRHAFEDSKMLSPLLFVGLEDRVWLASKSELQESIFGDNEIINSKLDGNEIFTVSPLETPLTAIETSANLAETYSRQEDFDENLPLERDYEYLEESPEDTAVLSPKKLLLLSYLPLAEKTLDTWQQQKQSPQLALILARQICQLFYSAYERGWCFWQIMPQFVQVDTNIEFYDLTSVHLLGESVSSGMVTEYCAPEVACQCAVSEEMSVYVIGMILYQAIHRSLPGTSHDLYANIQLIPGIYQIINLCLEPLAQNRISLNQLLKALSTSQRAVSKAKVQWDVASYSTVGLSLHRLQNEDSYGVQQYSTNEDSVLLGVLADGMGGMAKGEIASRVAVNTVLTAPLIAEINDEKKRENWLISVVEKANANVIENAKRGGTTLSVILAVEQQLAIAHVGDSRIFLIRNGTICQLSQDHSLVAALLANGDITYQDSQQHPQRNVIAKCLGAKQTLEDDYVQTLSSFGNLSIPLKDRDILLLCSDGVWDLVPATELAEIFTETPQIKAAVNNTISRILMRGASDNATLVALKCCVSTQI